MNEYLPCEITTPDGFTYRGYLDNDGNLHSATFTDGLPIDRDTFERLKVFVAETQADASIQ